MLTWFVESGDTRSEHTSFLFGEVPPCRALRKQVDARPHQGLRGRPRAHRRRDPRQPRRRLLDPGGGHAGAGPMTVEHDREHDRPGDEARARGPCLGAALWLAAPGAARGPDQRGAARSRRPAAGADRGGQAEQAAQADQVRRGRVPQGGRRPGAWRPRSCCCSTSTTRARSPRSAWPSRPTHPGLGFDEAATLAAQQFEFEPAEMDGKPIAVQLSYRYKFRLKPAETPPPPRPPPPPGRPPPPPRPRPPARRW